MGKEELLIEKEMLEERVEELSLEVETVKLELEHAEYAGTAVAGKPNRSYVTLAALSSPKAFVLCLLNYYQSMTGGGDGTDQDVQALAEQNAKLRAALKKLQEISSHEKQDLLRRQRELEREAGNAEAADRQARELKEWKAAKEKELEELHEMVEAGQVSSKRQKTKNVKAHTVLLEADFSAFLLLQAFESMVEALTNKNLELEEKVADLTVVVSELEVRIEIWTL